MTYSIRAALFAGALIVTGPAAFAETITLDQAIAKAVEASPLLKADDAAVAAARARPPAFAGGANPFLAASAGEGAVCAGARGRPA